MTAPRVHTPESARTPSSTAPPHAETAAPLASSRTDSRSQGSWEAALQGISRRAAINELLSAMALRERALAQLLQAEAEKVSGLARRMVPPESFDEVLTFQRTVAEIMHAVVRKEEILYRKLNLVLRLCEEDLPEGSGSSSWDLSSGSSSGEYSTSGDSSSSGESSDSSCDETGEL